MQRHRERQRWRHRHSWERKYIRETEVKGETDTPHSRRALEETSRVWARLCLGEQQAGP